MRTSEFYIKRLDWNEAEQDTCNIRNRVFAQEQGIPENLMTDESDLSAHHFLLYLTHQDNPVASARLLEDGKIGRVAVYKEFRGKQLGLALMRYVHDIARELNIKTTKLHAQKTSLNFYLKLGYIAEGESFEEAGIPHQAMSMELPSNQTPIEFTPDAALTKRPVTHQSEHYQSSLQAGYQPRALIPATETPLTEAILGESNKLVTIWQSNDIVQYIEAIIAQSSERVFIYSPTLPVEIYCQPAILNAISAMARRNPISHVQILVDDTAPLITQHHDLIQLQQRISSLINLRCTAKPYPVDSLGLILADDHGWLEFIDTNPIMLSGSFNNPGKVKLWRQTINHAWNHAEVPAEIRRFTL